MLESRACSTCPTVILSETPRDPVPPTPEEPMNSVPMEATLVFNPSASDGAKSGAQLIEILGRLQACQIHAEVIVVDPLLDAEAVSLGVTRAGKELVIVCGGDGTIESVALALVGTEATLGIIPTGTRNNIARSLGIPLDNIAGAVELLRDGRRICMDVGKVAHKDTSRCFLEAAAVGLGSALYSSADDIQHGKISKIGEFISTLVSASPSEFRLRLDDEGEEIVATAHMVIVANTPFMGASFEIALDVSFQDQYLDVFLYTDLSKRDLLTHALQPTEAAPDERIQRFRARSVTIRTDPAMPVIADGAAVGDGDVKVTLLPDGLNVIAGSVVEQGAAVTPTAAETAGA